MYIYIVYVQIWEPSNQIRKMKPPMGGLVLVHSSAVAQHLPDQPWTQRCPRG